MNIDSSSTASYIAAYQRSSSVTTGSMNIAGSYLEITGGVNGRYDTEDKAEISNMAKEMAQRIKDLDVFSVIFKDNDVRKRTQSLSEVETDFMNDFNSFASMFGKVSGAMGIDSSESYTIGLNGVGGLTVTGSNGETAENIQKTLGNQTTVARFAVMAARAALTDAGYSLDGFKESYANDPYAAIKDNIGELKDRLLGFRTTGAGGSMQYGFIRDFEAQIDYSSTTVEYTAAQAA